MDFKMKSKTENMFRYKIIVISLILTAFNAYAQKDNKGLQSAREALQQVTGQSADYIIVLDFEGFVKMVDYLGGINVNVERTFQDYEYPISGEEENTCGKNEDELKADLEKGNICFLHAPLFHPALKSVGPLRKNLGLKTFFTLSLRMALI